MKRLCNLSNFKGTRSDWTCHSSCLCINKSLVCRWLSALEICPTLKRGGSPLGRSGRHEVGSHHQSTASHGNVVVGCVAQSLHRVLSEGSPNFTPENSCAEEELPGTYKLCGLKKRKVGIALVSKVNKGDVTIWFGFWLTRTQTLRREDLTNSVTLYNHFITFAGVYQAGASVSCRSRRLTILRSPCRFCSWSLCCLGRLPRMHQGEACGAAQ